MKCDKCIRSEDKTYIEFPCEQHEGKICLYCGLEECNAGEQLEELLNGQRQDKDKSQGT